MFRYRVLGLLVVFRVGFRVFRVWCQGLLGLLCLLEGTTTFTVNPHLPQRPLQRRSNANSAMFSAQSRGV